MSSDDKARVYRVVLDSGYITDPAPSPMSEHSTEKPVFFGDDADDKMKLSECLAEQTRLSDLHEVDRSARHDDGVEDVSEAGDMCKTCKDVRDVEHPVFDLDETDLETDLQADLHTDLQTDLQVISKSNHHDMIPGNVLEDDEVTGSHGAVCVVPVPVMSASRLTCVLDQGASLKRSASLPDINTMRMRARREVGRRLRRLSDEFYYQTLFGRRCQTCSVLIHEHHTDDTT